MILYCYQYLQMLHSANSTPAKKTQKTKSQTIRIHIPMSYELVKIFQMSSNTLKIKDREGWQQKAAAPEGTQTPHSGSGTLPRQVVNSIISTWLEQITDPWQNSTVLLTTQL